MKVWLLIDQLGNVKDSCVFEDAPASDLIHHEGWTFILPEDSHWRSGYKYDFASKRAYDPDPPSKPEYPTKDEMETPDVIT